MKHKTRADSQPGAGGKHEKKGRLNNLPMYVYVVCRSLFPLDGGRLGARNEGRLGLGCS